MARTAGLIFCHLFSQTISFVFSSVPFSSLSKRPDCATAQLGRDCVSLLRADSRQHVRRILWPESRRSATMGVLKSVEPTGFLTFAPAFAGTNWADVDRRIIQNCPHRRTRVFSSPC